MNLNNNIETFKNEYENLLSETKDSNKEINTLKAAATMVCDHTNISVTIEERLERCSHPRGFEDYEVRICDVCKKVMD